MIIEQEIIVLFISRENIIKTSGTVILILLACFLFYKLTHRTYMKFIVQYDYVPAISKNIHLFRINVHYRGYDIGDVTSVRLSKDQKHIEFYVNINYKDIKLPTNSAIIFKNKNIYGQRYLDIKYPKNPSGKFFQDGDIINGTEVYERIDEYLLQVFTADKTEKFVQDLFDVVTALKKSLANNNNCKLLNQSAGDLAVILENLREITEDKSFRKDIKSTVKHSSSSLKNVDEILSNTEMRKTIYQTPSSVNQAAKNLERVTENMCQVGQILPNVNKNLDCINTLLNDVNCNLCTINTKVPTIPQSLVENAETLTVKTNYFESELSKMLSMRFAILRLIFGNPGKSFNKCAKIKCKCSK